MKRIDTSVVIRLHKYNNLHLLEECLFSIKGSKASSRIQIILTLQNFKGDKSEFESYILESFGMTIFLYIESTEDSRSRLLKKAFQQSNTKYLAILDYDDTTSVYGIATALAHLDKSPDLGAVFGRVDQYLATSRDKSRIVIEREKSYYTHDLREYLLSNPFPIHASVINQTVVDELPNLVDEKLIGFEDYWIFIQIITMYECEVLPNRVLMGHYYLYSDTEMNTNESLFDDSYFANKLNNFKVKNYKEILEKYSKPISKSREWYLSARRLRKSNLWPYFSYSLKIKYYSLYIISKLFKY